MKLPFIGLMGLGRDGMLYTPSGKRIFKVPMWLGGIIQRIQHRIAVLTWDNKWRMK